MLMNREYPAEVPEGKYEKQEVHSAELSVEVVGGEAKEILSLEQLKELFPTPEGFFENPCHQVLFENVAKLFAKDALAVTGEDQEYAKRFLATLTQPEGEAELIDEKEIELRNDTDIELTKKINELLADAGSSPLTRERKLLGIFKTEDEKPFEVVVVKVEDDGGFGGKSEVWKERTGSPTQFMHRDPEGRRVPTMYLPDYEAESIIKGDELSQFSKDAIAHEYRHTQRSFSFGYDRLFRLIDEVTTNVSGYNRESSLLSLLAATTPDMSRRQFTEAYESGDEVAKAKLLQQFSEAFGPKGLLLLGGRKSSEHSGDKDGLADMPLVEIEEEENNENARFAETLLVLRAEQSKDFLKEFQRRIHEPKIKRGTLEIWRDQDLPSWMPEQGGGYMTQVMDKINAEIKLRELKGEEGLYD